jgi:hypothetical protein
MAFLTPESLLTAVVCSMSRSSIVIPIALLMSVSAALFPSAHAQTSPTAEKIGPKLIEADPEAGFEYPYFLYTPETTRASAPILVEPNTSRLPSDNYDVHLKEAKREIREGLGRHLSNELAVPIVKPVFPRPASDPVGWTHSVQKLDRETMQIEEGPLRRVDQQLLSIVEDARKRL